LQEVSTEYAKSKGEYDSRLAVLKELYKDKEGYTGEDADAKIEQELVADLVGDYLFTDKAFVENLYVGDRGLFQKIFDEVKYLCKVVTAGSKEARQLEKVKKAFEEAYRAETKNPTADGGVRYSIVNLDSGKSYVQASRQIIHGNSVAEWRSQISDFFNRALKNGPIEIETIEGDTLTISKNTAKKARSKTATENGISRELTDKEFLVKLHAEAHIDELAEISHKNKRPPVPDGKNHSFAKDGFTYRTVYFQDFNGSYYRIALSVGENNGISTVYNVGKIKADDIPDGKVISTIGSKADMSSTKLSISNESEKVNTKNSLSDPNADIAPPIPSKSDVYGKDVLLDDIPIREDIQQKTQSNDADLGNVPIREDLRQTEFDGDGIRDQLRSNQDTLNTMDPVAEIQVSEDYAQLDVAGKKNWVVEKLRQTGYKVMRKGFGVIEFAKKRLKSAFNYFDKGSAEEAAFEALPYVLENGVEISSHAQHKGRDYGTVTIAAPITINGKRGNMAVVVKQTTGNYYKVHRILTPDGSVFVLPEMQNEAESTPTGESPKNGSLATSKDPASNISIPNVGENVKSYDIAPPIPESVLRKPSKAPAQVGDKDFAPLAEGYMNAEESQDTGTEDSKAAKILFGQQQTRKQKSAWKWAREHIFSYGAVFEDLSLKTGNRKLQAKFDNIRRAESRAQNFIDKGKYKNFRVINPEVFDIDSK